jgi:hypothetical protein
MYVGVSIIAIKTACLDEGVDLLGQLVSPSDQMMIERTSHDVRCPGLMLLMLLLLLMS